MKRTGVFAFLFLLVIFNSSVFAQRKGRKVVDKPYFIATSSSMLEITRVELTRDTTFLDIMIYGMPSDKVNIDTASVLRCNGNIYPLCGKENLAVQGEWVRLSDAGERSARIKFAPLPVDAEEFDFVEDADGGWKIVGVQLNGIKPEVDIPAELKNQQFIGEDEFPSLDLHFGKTIIRGKLLGYRPGSDIKIDTSCSSWFFRSGLPAEIPINEDGTFEIENYVVAPLNTTLYMGREFSIDVFSLPGSEVEVIIDLPTCIMANSRVLEKEYKGASYVWFKGDYAKLNTELQINRKLNNIIREDFFSDICGMTPLQYKKYCFRIFEKMKNAIVKNKDISEMPRRILLMNLEISVFNSIAGYKSNLSYAPMISGKEGVKRADMTIKDDYYDEILKMDFIDTPEIMISRWFKSYINYASEMFPDKISPQQPLWEDIRLTQKIGRQFAHFLPLNDEYRATADSIQSPEIRECIDSISNMFAVRLAESESLTGYTILQLDSEVANEQLVKAMVAPFENQVVLIDLWATWCGPCMRAMKHLVPLKEKYEAKEVTFLYVTNESSPEGNWKKAIADIKGNHYRLTDDQWKYLMTTHKLPGIPSYFLIDRNGEIVYKSIGFPGTEVLDNEIGNVLNKK